MIEGDYGLGMDALVTVCSWSTKESWFGHGCSGDRMFLEHQRNYGLGMDALVSVCSWNTKEIMGWGCSGDRMLLEHERNHGLDMDALVTYAFGR